jgi:hypothetical protein
MTVAENLAGVTVQIGFGVDAVGGSFFVLDDPIKGKLDDATYLLAPSTVMVDVTSDVASVSIHRGRERELDEYSTGKATVVFNDNDRTFDPSYTGSPYAGQITPMRRIQIRWQDAYLFSGWVDDWSVVYEPGDKLSRVTAECVDAFGILANQQLATIGVAFSGDLPGPRISRVLDRAEVAFPASRSIDAGNSTLGATTFGTNALAYLQQCARAEAGYLFVAADGTLTFRSRLATLNVPAGVVFSDDRTAGVPYRTVTQRSASDLLYTRVTGQSETTSNELTSTNTAAAAEYLIRTLALGSLFTIDDVQTQNIVDYYLERFSTVEVRFQSATVNLAACSTGEVGTVVDLDLSDVVTVQRSPLGVGAMIDRLSVLDGIAHRIGHGSWTVDLAFANADARAFFTLDDAILGELNAYRLAF